jgi:hypothetical protein
MTSSSVTVKDLVKFDADDPVSIGNAVDQLLELCEAVSEQEKYPQNPPTNESLKALLWDVDYGKLRRDEEKKN